MSLYMLDTNMVSYCVRQHPVALKKLVHISPENLCISSITEAEIQFGLAKRPSAIKLHRLMHEFLQQVVALPWGSSVAQCYGHMKAELQKQGVSLADMDMLIAAHAIDANAILVSHDRVFKQIRGLPVEDWLNP